MIVFLTYIPSILYPYCIPNKPGKPHGSGRVSLIPSNPHENYPIKLIKPPFSMVKPTVSMFPLYSHLFIFSNSHYIPTIWIYSIWRFPKSWGYPKSSKSLEVLKPMGGSPTLGNLHISSHRKPSCPVALFHPSLILGSVDFFSGARSMDSSSSTVRRPPVGHGWPERGDLERISQRWELKHGKPMEKWWKMRMLAKNHPSLHVLS